MTLNIILTFYPIRLLKVSTGCSIILTTHTINLAELPLKISYVLLTRLHQEWYIHFNKHLSGNIRIMHTYSHISSLGFTHCSSQEFLSSLGVVHRDLACRNVLVGEGKVLKITDFGMAREIDEVYMQKSKGRVPLKWMAIESIVEREFTTASDVWAYGITLWEITTMGTFKIQLSIHANYYGLTQSKILVL